jgi:hypothetical protein
LFFAFVPVLVSQCTALAREELEGIYARLPELIRSRHRTPKDLVVHIVLLAALFNPPPSVEVLKKFVGKEVGPDRMVLRKAGSEGSVWTIVQTVNGWKIVAPVKQGLDARVMKMLNDEIVVQLGLN